MTLEELQNIPSARDPWVVMQTVPTVYMDRVNVGGSESGQQSNYNAKGAKDTDNTWSIDGVPVTDMGATGASAFYYDFDSFQEMAITTGGADAQNPTGGVQLNMVLKKGRQHAARQRSHLLRERDAAGGQHLALAGRGARQHDRQRQPHRRVLRSGFDFGGPLLKDRVWMWGTMAWTDIKLLTLTGDPDKTNFKNYALKVDGQVNQERPRQLHVLREQQDEERPQRRPDPPAGNGVEPDRTDQILQGRGQLRRRQRACTRTAKDAHVDGGFLLAPVGGLAPGLLHRRRRRGAQHVLSIPEHPPAGLHRRRRQLFRRQARDQVRRRVAVDAGRHTADLAGEPPDRHVGRLPEPVRAGGARLSRAHRRRST